MKVKELITKLQTMPQESDVAIWHERKTQIWFVESVSLTDYSFKDWVWIWTLENIVIIDDEKLIDDIKD